MKNEDVSSLQIVTGELKKKMFRFYLVFIPKAKTTLCDSQVMSDKSSSMNYKLCSRLGFYLGQFGYVSEYLFKSDRNR